MGKTKLYDFPQAVRMVGETTDRVRYAVCYLQIVKPLRIGKARLFNASQIETIKQYFADKQGVLC